MQGESTMIQNKSLDIPHYLAIALMGISCHGEQQSAAVFVVDGRGMRVQHKGDGQEALYDEPYSANWTCTCSSVDIHTLIHSIYGIVSMYLLYYIHRVEPTSWSRRWD